MRALWLLTLFLTGCGSPILDHQTSSRPQKKTVSNSSSRPLLQKEPVSKSSSRPPSHKKELEKKHCEFNFEKTTLCAELRFLERPTYQASLKSFQAELILWDSLDVEQTVAIEDVPQVYHRCEIECCAPPSIEVIATSPNNFLLKNIEFHAVGWFDFLIEIHTRKFGIIRVQIPIEAFDV